VIALEPQDRTAKLSVPAKADKVLTAMA